METVKKQEIQLEGGKVFKERVRDLSAKISTLETELSQSKAMNLKLLNNEKAL